MKRTSRLSVEANRNKCRSYLNRYVRIRTVNGIFQGKIVKVDKHRVYLQTTSRPSRGKARISFLPFVLPLVLFDLLVIALVETRPVCRKPPFLW